MKLVSYFFATFAASLMIIDAGVLAITRTTRLPFTAKASTVNQVPRGGAIDNMMVAKTAVVAYGAKGAYCLIAVDKAIEQMGLTNGAKESFMALNLSAVIVNTALIPALQLFYGMSFQKAVGYSCLPHICVTLHKLFTGKHEQVGMPVVNGFFLLAINMGTMYAALNNLDSAMTIIKVYAAFSLQGLLFAANPKVGLDSWALMNASPSLLQLARYLGVALVGHGVVQLSQAMYDTPVLDAIGHWMAAVGITSLATYKGSKDMGNEQMAQLTLAGVAASLAISYYILK